MLRSLFLFCIGPIGELTTTIHSIKDRKIEEFEVHHTSDESVHGEVHITLYSKLSLLEVKEKGGVKANEFLLPGTETSSYQVTPADGSEIKGQCHRISDADFECSCYPLNSIKGTKLFDCETEYVFDDVDW